MIVVVDAGVAVKWYVEEEHTREAELLLDKRFEIHAPDLLLPEFGNVLWKKCRSDDLDENTARGAIGSIGDRGIFFHSSSKLLNSAFTGALETGQSYYDWTYLALAIALECNLVTADRRFFIALRNTRFKKYAVWIEHIETL